MTELLDHLKQADPFDPGELADGPSDETLRAILESRDRILAGGTAARRRRSLRVRVAAVAATAGLAAGAAAVLDGSSGHPLSATPAAAALHRLAEASAAYSDRALHAGELYYQRKRTYGDSAPGSGWVGGYQSWEEWISRDGDHHIRDETTGGGVRHWNPGHYALFGSKTRLTYEELLELPRNREALTEWVAMHARISREQDVPAPPNQMALAIIELLSAHPMPADLRAAFFRVASELEGIEYVGRVSNGPGRSGVAVGAWVAGGAGAPGVPVAADGTRIHQREDVIFDEATGEVLGTRTVVNGEITGTAILDSAIVGKVGRRAR